MWLEQSSEVVEGLRSFFLAYLIIIIAIFLSNSPSCLASQEFSAFRLQQFELHGTSYGSTGSVLSHETSVLPGSRIVSSPRRCYLVKIVDLTIVMYRELLKMSVAGILIIVPSDLRSLSNDTIEQIYELEEVMLKESTSVPVYLLNENPELMSLYSTVQLNAESLKSTASVFKALINNIHGNGIQFVTGSSVGTPKIKNDAEIANIQGALYGSKSTNNFPILIATHYDSMSAAADLSFGADSNGSGVSSLLELARIFSHLYNVDESHRGGGAGWLSSRSQKSILFLLSGGGLFNYHGTQKYLEEQLDSESSNLQETRLVICLDSLSGSKNSLFMHVSRNIREGSMIQAFINNLIQITQKLYPEMTVELVQRKVRTENLLSWEHEKFHLKKINALTLSSFRKPEQIHYSILDRIENIDIEDLSKKVHVIGEAIASSIYNFTDGGITFSGSLSVSKESIKSSIDYISSEPRSAQLLASKQNKFVQSLSSLLRRYTHETNVFYMKPEKRDSNLVFYDTTEATITAYEVKPAVFDLVLSCLIAAYLSVVYLLIKNRYRFSQFYFQTKGKGNGHIE